MKETSICGKRNTATLYTLFFAFFVLYVFFGACMSYMSQLAGNNVFFGADAGRVFADLTDIAGDHYRVKVHPLFLFFAQTIVLAVKGVIDHAVLAVIVVQAACGAATICFFWMILQALQVRKSLCIVFTLIYGFSYSNLVFAAVPESFVFAALGLISFWYFVLIAAKMEGPFSKTEWFLLAFWGVFNFGITLTNYVSYLIGLVFLLLCRYGIRRGVRPFVLLNVANGVSIVALCQFQKFVWPQAPLFWHSMIEGLQGAGYEELNYLNWQIGLSKTVRWGAGALCYPILAPDVCPHSKYSILIFGGYRTGLKVLILAACAIAGLLVLRKLIRSFSKIQRFENGAVCALTAALCFNLGMHYIYGSNEAFIYSPHYIFLFVILAAVCVNDIAGSVWNRVLQMGTVCFAAVQICNNVWRTMETARLAMAAEGVVLSLASAGRITLLCGAAALLVCAGLAVWNYRRDNRAEYSANGCRTVKCLRNGIAVYLCLAFAVSLFVSTIT